MKRHFLPINQLQVSYRHYHPTNEGQEIATFVVVIKFVNENLTTTHFPVSWPLVFN